MYIMIESLCVYLNTIQAYNISTLSQYKVKRKRNLKHLETLGHRLLEEKYVKSNHKNWAFIFACPLFHLLVTFVGFYKSDDVQCIRNLRGNNKQVIYLGSLRNTDLDLPPFPTFFAMDRLFQQSFSCDNNHSQKVTFGVVILQMLKSKKYTVPITKDPNTKHSTLVQPLPLCAPGWPTLFNLGFNQEITREWENLDLQGFNCHPGFEWCFYTFKQWCGNHSPRAGYLLKEGTLPMHALVLGPNHSLQSTLCWLIHHQLNIRKPQRPHIPQSVSA